MSDVKWTNEQLQAINEENSNILVAAAAGSGKTAVLVERIINKIINKKIDIDKLLVVTFTNPAASEMRERVLDALYKKLDEDPENENLQRQITLLNKSNICTIDSFCLDVVRNNFFELENISPNFRIGDVAEIELLKQEVIDDIFEQKYESEDADFADLINTYTSYKDDEPLQKLVLKIYTYIQSSPYPEKWLHEKVEMFNIKNSLDKDFGKTIWGEVLLQEVKEEVIDDLKALYGISKELNLDPELEKYSKIVRSDIDMLEMLQANLDNWDKAYNIYNNMSYVSWTRSNVESDLKDYAQKVRTATKEKLKEKLKTILISDSKEANQDIYDMYKILVKLEKLILDFDKEFTKRKRNKNIVDFNDIEHMALKILVKNGNGKIALDEIAKIEPTEIAKKYQQKFQEIAIDEYQDSNLVQEYILTAISNKNNMFMVGDVKQSIYKFRQAVPELFISKYKKYKNKNVQSEKDSLKIQLFKNFRSRDNVLQFTNLIFENIMSETLGDIDYNEIEFLNYGALDYKETTQNLKTEIALIDVKQELEEETPENEQNIKIDEEERLEDVQLEARFVANKIKKLKEEEFQIYDRKSGEFRPLKYKDVVILLRNTKNIANVMEEELRNLGLPVFCDSSQEYLGSIEIQTIMNVLKIIDNPIQDIPLVSVLRSPIGKFTDNELVEIRLTDKYDNFYNTMQKAKVNVGKELREKIEKFFEQLEKWREEQEYLALDEFIWKIYSDTSYYNYVGLMEDGELRQANLKMLFEKAKQYETASFKGLYNFINFIEKLKANSGDMSSAKIIGENDDVIRIMSIHKSKGLEFPIVFLSGTGKQFNLRDLSQNILLHQEMGIGVKYINYSKQVQYDTLSKEAIKHKMLVETLSEEMRILYVGLTRAKEKLYITATVNDYPKKLEKMEEQIERYKKENNKINPILIKKYKRYIDWLILVYLYEKNNVQNLIDFNVYKKNELIKQFQKLEKEDIDVISKIEEKISKSSTDLEKIKEILEYEYKYKLSTIIPTMTSVTKIKEIQNELKEGKQIENTSKLVIEDEFVQDEGEIEEKKGHNQFNKPKFLRSDEEDKLTNAQKGTLVHLCMQHLNEKVEYDIEKIKELINNLEEKEIITRKRKRKYKPI